MFTQSIAEITSVDLNDKRLERRAVRIAGKIAERPGESFPNIFPDRAELESFYRFVENPYFGSEALLKPHITATVRRAAKNDILVIHDTSEFVFSGGREDLVPSKKRKGVSFFGHCSLALRHENSEPLGMLRMQTWVRDQPTPTELRKLGQLSQAEARALPSEMDRWFEGVQETSKLLKDPSKLIHICDSEGDDYALQAKLVASGSRFVIRGCYDRKLEGTSEKLKQVLVKAPIVTQRVVTLSRRKKGRTSEKRTLHREERAATLEIRFDNVVLRRPKLAPRTLPESLEISVVYVSEMDPPEDCEPVEWILETTESVSTRDDVLAIVDSYRSRWIIEEFFKAIKTGCSYESRQLKSYDTLLKCLALFAPIAWLMLHMRFCSRNYTDTPAEHCLPSLFLDVLRHQAGKKITTAQDALLATAKLGGHIRNNGPPGWLVMWRGIRELATLARGYSLAMDLLASVKQKM